MGCCLESLEKFCPRPSLLILDPALGRASPCLKCECSFLSLFETWFFPPLATEAFFGCKKEAHLHHLEKSGGGGVTTKAKVHMDRSWVCIFQN